MSPPKKRRIQDIPQSRTPMREQNPEVRRGNFEEVTFGYSVEEALREAERCLDCARPGCVTGCPVHIDIPAFIRMIRAGKYREAYDRMTEDTLLPAVCGRVCRQEEQCEKDCTVGKKLEAVAIGRLERWLGDMAIEKGWRQKLMICSNGFRVGIVGSGPAGLACAADLARTGCEVTIFEALHLPGGVLRYGIPEFRLPDQVVEAEIENLKRLGVRVQCDTLVGRLFTLEQMMGEMGFHAVFIGTGAGYPKFMGIPGEGLNGVLSANEFLTRCNLMGAHRFPFCDTPVNVGRTVAVIGAGNTAMDATRFALRMGVEKVRCVYRRSRDESPARQEEIAHAEEEGVEFLWLTNPVEILGTDEGFVRGLRCVRMVAGEPDESGRKRPVPVPGSELEIQADSVIYAIGTNANPIMGQTSRLELNKRGYIMTNERLETSIPGIFAGGDIVTGAATVIQAMGAGRKAARSILGRLGVGTCG